MAHSDKLYPFYLFIFFPAFFFKFYFIFKLYIIVLVLPNIKMNLPQVERLEIQVHEWKEREYYCKETTLVYRASTSLKPLSLPHSHLAPVTLASLLLVNRLSIALLQDNAFAFHFSWMLFPLGLASSFLLLEFILTWNQFMGTDPDAGKDWRQEEKGTTEVEMVGWHHWLYGHKFELTLGDSEG